MVSSRDLTDEMELRIAAEPQHHAILVRGEPYRLCKALEIRVGPTAGAEVNMLCRLPHTVIEASFVPFYDGPAEEDLGGLQRALPVQNIRLELDENGPLSTVHLDGSLFPHRDIWVHADVNEATEVLVGYQKTGEDGELHPYVIRGILVPLREERND